MTANVKIPVASADNVTSVPLSAVFTEKNPDTLQMERFVYVQHGEAFEKRNVKVGISDYSFAEIQEGLTPGETVSLELPKEELEKKTKQISSQKAAGDPASRTSTIAQVIRTNAPAGAGPDISPKSAPSAIPAGTRSANPAAKSS